MDHFRVVIIGAGPAGLAAAMQLTRQGQQVLVLERRRVGGLLWNANLLENYPGFPQGISGPDLAQLFQRQAERLQVQVDHEEALRTTFQEGVFRIETDKRVLTASCLVAASGTTPRQLSAPAPAPGVEDRIFSEVYPLLGRKDLKVLIIGAGDAAFDYALNLADQNQVSILNRGSEIKALPLLVERAAAHPRIAYHAHQPVNSIHLTDRGDLQILAGGTADQRSYQADYIIAAVGREPETSFADPSIIKRSGKLIDQGRMYMIGDVANGNHRQTAIAVGDGIHAAMRIAENLQKDNL